MTYEELNAFYRELPAASYCVQWGGSHVWKVDTKVFVIGGWEKEGPAFSFKVSAIAFEMLTSQPGLRPAPYLASRALSWVQTYGAQGLRDEDLEDYIRSSHRLVASVFSQKRRRALGLL